MPILMLCDRCETSAPPVTSPVGVTSGVMSDEPGSTPFHSIQLDSALAMRLGFHVPVFVLSDTLWKMKCDPVQRTSMLPLAFFATTCPGTSVSMLARM